MGGKKLLFEKIFHFVIGIVKKKFGDFFGKIGIKKYTISEREIGIR